MYIDYIKESSLKLKEYIEATLKTYKEGINTIKEKEFFSLESIVKNCNKLLNPTKEYDIRLSNSIEIFNYKSYFEQILLNLISNAIKYNDKPKVIITIAIEFVDNYCYLTIKDNGIGIEADKIDHIFDMFNTLEIMAITTIRKELQDFLEKEGILESFIENVKNEKTFRNYDDILIIYVNTAFRWRLS